MIDETEQHKGASAAVDKDLPYNPEWPGLIETAYKKSLKESNVKLRQMFDAALPLLTNGRGLFVNILMQGRGLLLNAYDDKSAPYETIFEFLEESHDGETKPPWPTPPYVLLNRALMATSESTLSATMIHEYTHLATWGVYRNGGDPWHDDTKDKKEVTAKLAKTYPIKNTKDEYGHWQPWLNTLSNQELVEQIKRVLTGYASYKTTEDWNREALPHVVEIIYHLYNARINWWTIAEGPINEVADLLAKFAYTATN